MAGHRLSVRSCLMLVLPVSALHNAAPTREVVTQPRPETHRSLDSQCQPWCNQWTCNQVELCGSCSICMPAPPPAPLSGVNPFADVDMFVDSHYAARVQRTAAMAGGDATDLGAQIMRAAGIPTAIWLDEIAAISKMRVALEQARIQQQATGVTTLCTFVVYNLPGRDCSAQASSGEMTAGELRRYEGEFLEPIRKLAAEFAEVRKVFILEPDSLPNLVTNAEQPRCKAASDDYKNGIAAAIRKLGPLGSIYVDAGWSGWIGTWSANRMAEVLVEVIGLSGDAAMFVRGFVINTSNYGSITAEAAYGGALRAALATQGNNDLAFVIDTGRNGQTVAGKGTWCNPKGAGLGRAPTAQSGIPFADALLWIKPPGESDGTSLATQPRFDPACAHSASWKGAPQAGDWFNEQFKELVQLAAPPIATAPSYTHVWRPFRPPSPPSPPPPSPLPPRPSPPAVLSPPIVIDELHYEAPAWIDDPTFDIPPSPPPPRPVHHWMHRARPPPTPSPEAATTSAAVIGIGDGDGSSDSENDGVSMSLVGVVTLLALVSLFSGKSSESGDRNRPIRATDEYQEVHRVPTRADSPQRQRRSMLPPHVTKLAREKAKYAKVARPGAAVASRAARGAPQDMLDSTSEDEDDVLRAARACAAELGGTKGSKSHGRGGVSTARTTRFGDRRNGGRGTR